MPARLRPTAPIAADAVLVGDPGRALLLAQELLEQPKMSNHARGLWGYSGRPPAGRELTIQATGMGGPSAAIVLADLAELGVRRAVRVGTCTALRPRADGRRPARWSTRRSPGRQRGGPGSRAARRSLPDPDLPAALRAALGDEAQGGDGRQPRPRTPARAGAPPGEGRRRRHADGAAAGPGRRAGDRRGGGPDRRRGAAASELDETRLGGGRETGRRAAGALSA